MGESINGAKGAVEAALERVDFSMLRDRDREGVMVELGMELIWIICFLINSERTSHGRMVAGYWCPVIVLLAGRCDYALLKNTQRLDNLCKKFASLRQKVQPLVITCQCHPPSSSSSPVSFKGL
ncbi:unnamed protein product [Cuscuta epithymum]|uniref:Uncharacterized protein n=1 Tax=Cuscuta epithymum TaxID=186058 RepID=A0AAV0DDE1_9ASTE|nr:unnamed protein product [Cuscuta epithymum]